jgi:hypothetical protein
MNSERTKALERAIEAALGYILNGQRKDGSWVDWRLPAGESDAWTTAYVGYQFRLLPASLRARAAAAVDVASKWLLNASFTDGGWGYNTAVGTDADSTAYAILCLSSSGRPVPEKSYRCLRKFQCSDGGFSTYIHERGIDSWVVSHPDVSPIALLALLTKYSHESPAVRRGIDYVSMQRNPSGLWNSFWWNSFLYSTKVNLSLLKTVRVQFDTARMKKNLSLVRPQNAFEMALLVSILLCSDSDAATVTACQFADQLIQAQLSDGSWRSERILRVTKRDCFQPWNDRQSGTLFSDPNRLFTSSTVLEGLSKVHAVL